MTEPDAGGRHLVVVGSSAGGIEALSVLVATLPADLQAPVIVAQHLDRRGPSHLVEILARRTTLPVAAVEDHHTLEPGTIYVVPANRHVAVTDHEVRVVTALADGPAPSIDRLLSSAADVFGEGLVAIILTGMGTDGAAGARLVKAAGGSVVVQNPRTARFPSMPTSLAPTTVDIVANVDDIGPLLPGLLRDPVEPDQPRDEALLRHFLERLRDHSGIDFGVYKRPTILRRLQRRFAATGNAGFREYVRYVDQHPEEFDKLGTSFLIKVTEFFRDPELFDHLRTTLVPQLIDEARGHGRELRFWSAGCATGEEAYSLAMIVADELGDKLNDWSVRIFATDLDAEAISFARRGIYPPAALAHLDASTVERHFALVNGEYEVRKPIRSMTVFGQHDLANRGPFPRIDLVLCRNVLIYFTPELQRRALQLFAFSLRDGGWLALGKAETTSPLADHFGLDDTRLRIYRRRGERLMVPPSRSGEVHRQVANRPATRAAPPAALQADLQRRFATAESAEMAIAAIPIGLVVVDARYDIKSINPAARELLGIHGSAVDRDLIHLAERLPSAPLRRAIDSALRGTSQTIQARTSGAVDAGEAPTLLEIACHPAGAEADGGTASRAVIVIRDASPQAARVADPESGRDTEPADGAHRARQAEAYREGNRRLLEANRELTTENVELRGSNEQLLVANEEVQAATEEVETLNEELQATNEELETLNEELQATVEELNTTNDDMQARSAELQQMTRTLDEQRRLAETEMTRLSTVLESLNDAVAVIDSAGDTIIRNATYRRLFEEESITPDRRDGEAALPIDELRRKVARGEEFLLHFRVTDPAGQRSWYEAWGRPVPAAMGIGEGGIIVVHDTTDLSLRRLQGDFLAMVAHELRTPLTALRGYLQMLNQNGARSDGRITTLAARQAERLTGLVDELFDVTRTDTGRLDVELRRVPLDELVEETVAIAQTLTDRQTIRLEADAREIVVEGDPGRLEQVLLNLVTNAIVHAGESKEIVVRLRRLRRWAEIEVEDHGPGIPETVREHLFSRFQQGRPAGAGGLGLGLYLSRQIVAAHNGTIEVDSELGEGSTFTVRLPVAIRPLPATIDENRAADASDGRRRVESCRKTASARRGPAR